MCGEPESDHEADLAGTDQSAPNGPLKRLEPLIDRGTHSADDGRDWFPVVDERERSEKGQAEKDGSQLGRWDIERAKLGRPVASGSESCFKEQTLSESRCQLTMKMPPMT
jgi:hypothetical protein